MKWFILYLLIETFLCVLCYDYDDLNNLMSKLFHNTTYNKNIRPIKDQNQKIEVNVIQGLYEIHSLDVTGGHLIVVGFLEMSWRDEYLVWNQSEYGGVNRISVDHNKIWEPGLVQKDGVHADSSGKVLNTDFYRIFLSSDGEVHLSTAGYFGSNCNIDTKHYPFDTHECHFNFISFKYTSYEVALRTPNEVSLAIYTEDDAWDISDTLSQSLATEFDGDYLSNIQNTVTLRRKPLFVFVNRYMPLMLLTILNAVTSMIPQSCGERISFAVTIYLAFIFMSVSLVDDLPQNSISISLSSYGVLIVSLFNTSNVIWSVAITRMSVWNSNNSNIPKLLINLVRCLRSKKVDTTGNDVIDISNDSSLGKENIQSVQDMPIDEADDTDKQEVETVDAVTWCDVISVLDKIYFGCTFLLTIFVMIIIITFWVQLY
ncbi:hypothetical protein ACF0H5_013678 [Mactra antiquata]